MKAIKSKRRRITCKSCNGSGRIDDHESPVRRCDDCMGLGCYHATPKAKKVKARVMWMVRIEGGEYDLFDNEIAAQNNVEAHEDQEIAASMEPVFVIPASPAEVDEMQESVARALDPLAFREYKEGECLPRGHETDTVERVNEMQEWRRRAANGRARKALAALGLRPAQQGK